MDDEFARLIASARERLGVTQPDLQAAMARAGAPVSVNTISMWCTGARRPHRDRLEALLDCLAIHGEARNCAYRAYATPPAVR